MRYPGAYADVSFLVWSAYEAVLADWAGNPQARARFAAVPLGDRALIAHHVEEVGSLVIALQRALGELRCREARSRVLNGTSAMLRSAGRESGQGLPGLDSRPTLWYGPAVRGDSPC